MKNYKLADGVISVGAMGNKIFFSEDNGTYPETCWKPGEADELVSRGFLKVILEDKPEQKKEIAPPVHEEKKEKEKEEMDGIDKSHNSMENPAPEKIIDNELAPSMFRKLDDIDIKELRLDLIGKKIKFNPNASKEELYQLYVKSF